MLRPSAPPRTSLTPKQRLALVHSTSVSTGTILNMKDEDIDFAFVKKHGIPAHNLAAAGVTPLVLKARGAGDAYYLVTLGYDALHLVDPVFCDGAISAFGAASVIDAFVSTPLDAVSIAGSAAVDKLGVSTQALLETCAGASIEAFAILQVSPCEGVRTATLLDAGLRGRQLKELAWSEETLGGLVGTRAELAKLLA